MGYISVNTVLDHLQGIETKTQINTGEYVATSTNLNAAESQRLLHPEMAE